MSWKKLNIHSPVLTDASSAVATAAAVVSAVSPVLNSISTLLNAAAVIASGTTDPFQTFVNTAISELTTVVNDLFGTGIFMLNVSGFNVESTSKHRVTYDIFGFPILHPFEAISAAVDSFDDTGDLGRPQFSSTANISAFGIMITLASLQDFINLLNSTVSVLSIPHWEFIKKETVRYNNTTTRPSVRPDWLSLKINSIQPFRDVQDGLLSLLNTLKGYLVVADQNIASLAAMLAKKVNDLQVIINKINAILSTLLNAQGIYILNVAPGVGGNARVKAALHDATLENQCLKNDYTVMTLFVAGTTGLVPLSAIRSIIS